MVGWLIPIAISTLGVGFGLGSAFSAGDRISGENVNVTKDDEGLFGNLGGMFTQVLPFLIIMMMMNKKQETEDNEDEGH